MKLLNRFIVTSFVSVLFLSACKDDDNRSKNLEQSTSTIKQELQLNFSESNMIQHLRSLQDIAHQNGGHRAVGSKGAHVTAEYIIKQSDQFGFKKTLTSFDNKEGAIGQNIVIEIPGQSASSVILIGTHYDSVKGGPGINDNGSGIALLLELMNQLGKAKQKPKDTIRLAFWDSEEVGTMGSSIYADKLSRMELDQIKAYINIDMVGAHSPTAIIPDSDKTISLKLLEAKLREKGQKSGDVSEEEIQYELDRIRKIPTHPQDFVLEKNLENFFKAQNIVVNKNTIMSERTDIASFVGKVPVTGFILSDANFKGEDFIPCYHEPCDTLDKVEPKSLTLSGNAIVYLLKNLKTL